LIAKSGAERSQMRQTFRLRVNNATRPEAPVTGRDLRMLCSKMFLILGPIGAMTIMAQGGSAWAAEVPRKEGGTPQFQAQPTRTGKERLGGKASDEQRVDNCKVPLDLRGPTPRPGDCGDGQASRR
jgi:hypothetical protein